MIEGKLDVLIVDDSAVMRAMIKRTLVLSGVPVGQILEAGHGVEALEQLANHWVDLALLDINMPVMNGEELLERIRANEETRALAAIVVSTESSDTRLARLREFGVEIVHKPFTPEQLRDTVHRVTGFTHVPASDDLTDSGSDFDF
jgi:two-component system, chemotaxis family, chemotaxis protein CheY